MVLDLRFSETCNSEVTTLVIVSGAEMKYVLFALLYKVWLTNCVTVALEPPHMIF